MSQLIGSAHPRSFGLGLAEPQEVLDLMARRGADAPDALYGENLPALLPASLDDLLPTRQLH